MKRETLILCLALFSCWAAPSFAQDSDYVRLRPQGSTDLGSAWAPLSFSDYTLEAPGGEILAAFGTVPTKYGDEWLREQSYAFSSAGVLSEFDPQPEPPRGAITPYANYADLKADWASSPARQQRREFIAALAAPQWNRYEPDENFPTVALIPGAGSLALPGENVVYADLFASSAALDPQVASLQIVPNEGVIVNQIAAAPGPGNLVVQLAEGTWKGIYVAPSPSPPAQGCVLQWEQTTTLGGRTFQELRWLCSSETYSLSISQYLDPASREEVLRDSWGLWYALGTKPTGTANFNPDLRPAP